MKNKIDELLNEVNNLAAKNLDELENLRIKYLSKKGEISNLFNDFRNVANEEKREVGQLLNELKNAAQDKINELKNSFDSSSADQQKTDLSRTADPIKLGTRHPLSLVKNEIIIYSLALDLALPRAPR
jgi:phenylalanyl-tRNA synthetase alpha chain